MHSRDRQKEDEKPLLAAIYARTSSPNQKVNYSIKEQVNRCWKYCKQRSWIVRYVFIDEGESGGTIERPKFQLMLEQARAHRFDVILFWKLDRFCRSLVDLVNIERALRKWGLSLCSVTEFIDTTTSIGRFNYRNLASVAELERELIGERARLGLYALAKDHKWPNPHPPLGYDKKDDGRLMVNTEEAKLVRQIFEMYLEKKSMPQVAFELNKQSIHTKKGKRWNARAVRKILTNKIYTGKYNVAGVNDHVEKYRIVEDDFFKKARETRLRFKRSGAKRPPMPKNRRRAKIMKVFSKFLEFLEEIQRPNTSKQRMSIND